MYKSRFGFVKSHLMFETVYITQQKWFVNGIGNVAFREIHSVYYGAQDCVLNARKQVKYGTCSSVK